MTSLEFLPNGWELKTINEIGDLHSGSTPSTRVAAYWNGEIIWITPNDLSNLNTRFINSSERTITYQGLKNSSAKLLPARSLVISSRAPIGYLALPTSEFCTNQGCKSLVFGEEQNPEFHYYNFSFRVRQIREKGEGTTFAEISKTALGQIAFPVPKDRHTQTKIAEVLTAVDLAITQTETLIAKHQRIKTGLMQDLLTRGIDENGNLRDPATHKFKDSPLGQVPKEWEVITLGEVVAKSRGTIQTGPFGSQLHAHEYTPEGVPVIMPQDMLVDGSIDFQQIARIPPTRANDLKRHLVKNNDVVFARRGDLSRCVSIHKDDIGLCGTGCLLVRIPEEILSATWLSFIYRHEKCQRQIAARAVGSTMVNLNTQLLANLIITRPRIEEQLKISAKIKQLDTLIDLEITRLNKLKKVKTGLMQDLLTGKVSVAPLLNSVEEG